MPTAIQNNIRQTSTVLSNQTTPNKFVISTELKITDPNDLNKTATFGSTGLSTTNPFGLLVDSDINMRTNDIINVTNLSFLAGNITGLQTINGDPYPPVTTASPLELVLFIGNDANNIGIENLRNLTFFNEIDITDNNCSIKNTGGNLQILSQNLSLILKSIGTDTYTQMYSDTSSQIISFKEIIVQFNISNNNDSFLINNLNKGHMVFSQGFQLYDSQGYIANTNVDNLDISYPYVNFISVSDVHLKTANLKQTNMFYEDLNGNSIKNNNSSLELSTIGNVIIKAPVNMENNNISYVKEINFNRNPNNKITEDIYANLIIQSPNQLSLIAGTPLGDNTIQISDRTTIQGGNGYLQLVNNNPLYLKSFNSSALIQIISNRNCEVLADDNIILQFNTSDNNSELTINNFHKSHMVFSEDIKIYDNIGHIANTSIGILETNTLEIKYPYIHLDGCVHFKGTIDIFIEINIDFNGYNAYNVGEIIFKDGITISDNYNNSIIATNNKMDININNIDVLKISDHLIDFSNNIIPTRNTAIIDDSSRQIATTEFVQTAIQSGGLTGVSIPYKINGILDISQTFWSFNISANLGKGFMFTIYGNTSPPSYIVNSGDTIHLQGQSISVLGYATCQSYKVNGTDYYCYILTLVSYTGIPNLIFETKANGSLGEPIYTLNCSPYTFNFDMEMIIYPSTII
jgi:hypothetical protein